MIIFGDFSKRYLCCRIFYFRILDSLYSAFLSKNRHNFAIQGVESIFACLCFTSFLRHFASQMSYSSSIPHIISKSIHQAKWYFSFFQFDFYHTVIVLWFFFELDFQIFTFFEILHHIWNLCFLSKSHHLERVFVQTPFFSIFQADYIYLSYFSWISKASQTSLHPFQTLYF